jgi:polyisoprenoid-binding protein YceI
METVKWLLDPSHSEVQFKVRHRVSKVTGHFDEFTVRVKIKTAILNFLNIHSRIQKQIGKESKTLMDGCLKKALFEDTTNL